MVDSLRWELEDAIAFFALHLEDAHPTTLAASELIASGVDTPGLRELAGFTRNASWWEVRDTAAQACLELGLRFVESNSVDAHLAVLAYRCREYLAGRLSVDGLGVSAGRHETAVIRAGMSAAQELILLDSQYEWERLSSEQKAARADAAATTFLVSYPRE